MRGIIGCRTRAARPQVCHTEISQSGPFPRMTACIFNIMRFATHDGPGIRTTIFFKGCPLACSWCHNPESQRFSPDRLYFENRCRHCLDCISACPEQAIHDENGTIVTGEACTRCGHCTTVCMTEARQVAGRRYTVAELIAEIEKDLVFFDDSGGGVSLSGGEPLAQPAFVAAFLTACRERGIGTVIETCGYAQPDTFLNTALLAGQILFDLKLIDPEKHRQHTGLDNHVILRNLQAVIERHADVTVRIPVVPGINTTGEDLSQFAATLAKLRPRQIELLPYHPSGAAKYERLGIQYTRTGTQPPTEAEMHRFRDALARNGLNVTIGG